MNQIRLTKEQANDLAEGKKIEIDINGKVHILEANYDFDTEVVLYDSLVHYVKFIVKNLTTNEFYISNVSRKVGNTVDILVDSFKGPITLRKVKRIKTTITVEKWQIVE